MECYNLFSSPLFKDYFYIDDTESIISIIRNLRNNFKEQYSMNSFTSYSMINDILEIEILKPLKCFILEKVKEINLLSEIYDEINLDHSWFSINEKGGFHEEHSHLPSIWSGVYYLKAGSHDSNIVFVNKNLTDTGWPYTSNKNVFNPTVAQQTSCTVDTGMLLIFPGYLRHKVEQQISDSERITISFNTKFIQ